MELQGEWPEPVVSVQSLLAGGLTAIPERYVKPPSQRPAPRLVSPTDLPLVDLGGLTGSTPTEFQATVRKISDACKEWGFFQVVNHGVSPDLMKRMMVVWRDFFLLPLEEKRAFANSPRTYEGYGSRIGVEKGTPLDWGDYFFLNFLPLSKRNYEKWPALFPPFRETVEEYGGEVVKLAERLMRALSISLGLEAGRLQEAFGGRDVDVGIRVNYYPKCPQPHLTLGLSSHSDPGGLTILLADDHVKGLQVKKGGGWVTVQPVPGAFVVNLGDQIQVLSNTIYKSVEHQAVVNSDEERLSIAVFYNPKGEMLIGPIPELVNKGCTSSYSPITFNEYRLFIRTKGPRGKIQLESCLKAI
ncbi:hypothetical protein Taro_045864 [Colocasia esculenta]|uniref:Fe2OG dioxygenase domain-containing protein n=1 Tax=Colocasia esculenta TaxID=4460 RepID=A0A843X5E4_COLES|nr:hypothetical protein [Colocasia esculenta]